MSPPTREQVLAAFAAVLLALLVLQNLPTQTLRDLTVYSSVQWQASPTRSNVQKSTTDLLSTGNSDGDPAVADLWKRRNSTQPASDVGIECNCTAVAPAPDCKSFKCEPVDCRPVEIQPQKCEPVACKQVDCKPVDCKPVDCKPVKCGPQQCKPTDCKPVADEIKSEAKTAAAVETPPLFWSSEELGVFHYRIPGEYNESYGIVMHVMLKAIKDDDSGMTLRGSAFAEIVEPEYFKHTMKGWQSRYHIAQPVVIGKEWTPRIWLKGVNGVAYDFNVTVFSLQPPCLLRMKLSRQQLREMPSAGLRIDKWMAWYEVWPAQWGHHLRGGSLLQRHKPPPLPQNQKRLVIVQAYVWGTAAINSAPLVVQSIRYHLKLGVSSFFMYVMGGMLHSLTESKDAVALIQAGQLRLVDWTAQIPQYDQVQGASDQMIMLTHAVMVHASDNVLLMITDLDEFLISFKPIAPEQLVPMMQDIMGERSEVSLGRVETMCEDCYGTKEAPVKFRRGQPSFELFLWEDSNLTSDMSRHPLWHYPLVPVEEVDKQKQLVFHRLGKSFVDPGKASVWEVHNGWPLPGGGPNLDCRTECKGAFEVGGLKVPPLLFLHLNSMYGVRGEVRPWDDWHFMRRTEWQWALKA